MANSKRKREKDSTHSSNRSLVASVVVLSLTILVIAAYLAFYSSKVTFECFPLSEDPNSAACNLEGKKTLAWEEKYGIDQYMVCDTHKSNSQDIDKINPEDCAEFIFYEAGCSEALQAYKLNDTLYVEARC